MNLLCRYLIYLFLLVKKADAPSGCELNYTQVRQDYFAFELADATTGDRGNETCRLTGADGSDVARCTATASRAPWGDQL